MKNKKWKVEYYRNRKYLNENEIIVVLTHHAFDVLVFECACVISMKA